MNEREEVALLSRVGALEDALKDMGAVLRKFNAKVSQPDLLPVVGTTDEGILMVALRESLVARYAAVTGKKYIFDGAKDAAAVKRLFKLKPELYPELLDRWEECLRLKAYPGTQSLAQFASRANEFGKRTSATLTVVGDPYST